MNITELARQCGVSTATISRAFDKNSVMKESTRKKILDTARDYNYSPNLIARSLKKNRTQTVGFVIPSVDNHFYINVLKYIEIELKKYDYRLIISFIQEGVQTENEAISVMLASHVDALIFVPTDSNNSENIRQISNNTYFIQLFGQKYDFLDSVFMDDRNGVKIAVDYLIKKGHRKILYSSECPQYDMYEQAFRENGIEPDFEYILKPYSTVEEVSQKILILKPSAVLGVALHCETAWRAVRSLGYNVPENISFMAYDDLNWINMLGITAISHNYIDIAENVVKLIMQNLKQKQQIRHIMLMPYITERSSIKNII